MIAYILVFALGLLAGYILFHPRDDSNYPQYTKVWIQDGTNHAIILRSIDPDRLSALAYRLSAGRKFRFKALVGQGKLLRRSEWDKLTRELVDRELMIQQKNRIYQLTPTGQAFFSKLANPLTRANNTGA